MSGRLKGRIIKGIAGFYYVDTAEGLFECKAKGLFRKEGKKPLVGDICDIEIIDKKNATGNLVTIQPRRSELNRPPVANVDQALVMFALREPSPNMGLLDRILVNMEYLSMPVSLCFNKTDLDDDHEVNRLRDTYEKAGYRVMVTSVEKGQGIEEIKESLKHKLTAVAGPSGVGKSSLINSLQSEVLMDTDALMKKMDSGKQTTRHSQLITVLDDTYIMDTPGFGSMYLPKINPEELDDLFPEFREYRDQCQFVGCAHIHEPNCMIKQLRDEGQISQSRYENYAAFYAELKNMRKYK